MPDRRIRHKDEELDAKCWSTTVSWAEMISGCAKSANHAWPLGNNSTGLPVELTLEYTRRLIFVARLLHLGENRLPVAANCGTIPNAISDSLLELKSCVEQSCRSLVLSHS